MKRLAIYLLIGCWGLALAQAPPDETVDADEAPATDIEVLEEEEPAAIESETDPERDETDPDFEASVEDVFKPGDEISEDFPIPLPADI